MEIDKESLKNDFIKLGLKEKDIIEVHSSLKKIGWIIGGAETLINALLEIVSPEGTILMPTFTYSFPLWTDYQPFEKNQTPSKVGLVSDIFWRRKEAKRSNHPGHSVTAIGKYAEEFIKDHENKDPIGIDSPFHRAAQKNGYVLLIGVTQTKNSLLHVAEVLAKVPYLDIPVYQADIASFIDEIGQVKRVKVRVPGDSMGFDKIESLLREKGIVMDGYIGNAFSSLINGKELLKITVEILKKDPYFLLCDNPHCKACCSRQKNFF